ncbi:MAG: UDP-N-acetylglucosamine 2-epimerase (non-hydrolyzing) [Candidatus Omnitrophica bacterium]|nr:UDP-N-acetylglucosamine 2-epimerase (non-hydrolyzing) [Candidatus Omnitrophota bacterium]
MKKLPEKSLKVAMVVGARPQFVKASMLVRALDKHRKIDTIIIHTGQHYDKNMSHIFFKELKIKPAKYNLGIGSAAHGLQTGLMLAGIEKVLQKEKPDCVVVFGDTNSTLAGALAASKTRIEGKSSNGALRYPCIVHVEAGVRSYRKHMPEEINRTLTDRICDIHFCPSASAVENLKKEGIKEGLYNVGDIMYDSLIHFKKNIENRISRLSKWGLASGQYYLATVHRQCNTDVKENLKKIIDILESVDKPVLFPAHPRTKKAIKALGVKFSNIRLIRPLAYFDMLLVEKNAKLIITDSGGVQKEAFYLQVPCIVLREESEWRELLDTGCNVLTGLNKRRVFEAIARVSKISRFPSKKFYGSGSSSFKMAEIIKKKAKVGK